MKTALSPRLVLAAFVALLLVAPLVLPAFYITLLNYIGLYAMVALGCASFALAQTFPQFLAAMALFTFGEMLSLPVAAGYGSQLAPAQFRGRYFGWSTVVWSIAGMAGSSGVWFYGTVGAVWWLWSGLVAGVGTLVMWPRLRARPVIDETAAAPAK